MTGAVPTNLMRIVDINGFDIGVNSQATAPAKPDIVTITPTQVQGWYYKVITIRVVRPNATAEPWSAP